MLVDRRGTIRGGACLIHDGHIGNPAVPGIVRDLHGQSPAEAVAACLLGILGIDVSAADAANLPLLNQNRLAPWAIEALGRLYRPS